MPIMQNKNHTRVCTLLHKPSLQIFWWRYDQVEKKRSHSSHIVSFFEEEEPPKKIHEETEIILVLYLPFGLLQLWFRLLEELSCIFMGNLRKKNHSGFIFMFSWCDETCGLSWLVCVQSWEKKRQSSQVSRAVGFENRTDFDFSFFWLVSKIKSIYNCLFCLFMMVLWV